MPLNVIFIGNGPFAVPALQKLVGSRHRLLKVVARPDRPQGKKLKVEPGPVALYAEQNDLPIDQPENVNDAAYVEVLRNANAEVFVVVDFGQILSPACLSAANFGGLNIHGSLLPKYRGAAPIAWAIYHGETEVGVSILQMTPVVDAGGVVSKATLAIDEKQTCGEVEPLLAELGAHLITDVLDRLEQGPLTPEPQDSRLASKAPKLTKENGRVLWNRPKKAVVDQFRAMSPWPGVFFEWRPASGALLRVKIERLNIAEATDSTMALGEPGTVAPSGKGKLLIWAADGLIAIEEITPAGKDRMSAAEYLNGRSMQPGEKLIERGSTP